MIRLSRLISALGVSTSVLQRIGLRMGAERTSVARPSRLASRKVPKTNPAPSLER